MSTTRARRARVVLGATVIAGVGLMIATASTAAQPPAMPKRPVDVDVRLDYPLEPGAVHLAAAPASGDSRGNGAVRPQQGTVSRLFRYGGYLTGSSKSSPAWDRAGVPADERDAVRPRRRRPGRSRSVAPVSHREDGGRAPDLQADGRQPSRLWIVDRIHDRAGRPHPDRRRPRPPASPSLDAAEAVVEAARAIGTRSRGPLARSRSTVSRRAS